MEKKITGLYLLDDPAGTSDSPDMAAIADYAKHHPGVIMVLRAGQIRRATPKALAQRIKKANLSRIIIAGLRPGMAKGLVARAMLLSDKSPEDIILAGFEEHGALHKSDTDLACAIIACAVSGVPFHEATEALSLTVNPATLVIGGGIAGIQASLEVADSGQKVYLVERTATIGGYMATFDKTFPTLDCAACILTPKMVEVVQHKNISLMTYSEVKEVSGVPGEYKVKILKKARYVNLATCIGCGQCAEKCPVKVGSEFDSCTSQRKSIYIPFPQAVPNKYLIDKDSCTYLKSKKCGVCAKVCPVPGCIDYEAKDEEVEVVVGQIIVATGYKPFDAKRDDRFGYGKFPNVVTSLEFERLVNAAGPTGGAILLKSQDKKSNWVYQSGGKEPESVAIIHCVGSRDENFNRYCSKVCCMYSLKLAHLVAEKLPKAKVYEYYIDIRAFGKGYEEFYNRIKHEGIQVIRGRTAKVEEKEGKLWLKSEDILNNRLTQQPVDMVVLSVGLEPREDADALSVLTGIARGDDGWFLEADALTNPTGTSAGGVSIAGACQGPKDIPDTVAQASAAASRVIRNIMTGKVSGHQKEVTLKQIEANIAKLTEA